MIGCPDLYSAFIAMLIFWVATPAMAEEIASPGEVKPLVVLVFDQNCKVWCSKTRPIMAELQKEYGERVTFSELDSTQSQLPESRKKAKELGILGFFSDVADYVPVVVVFSARRALVKELTGPKTKSDYQLNIEKSLIQK